MGSARRDSLRRSSTAFAGFDYSQARKGGGPNEDACLVDDDLGLYVVADGMGGYQFAQEASVKVVETVKSIFEEKDPASVVPGAERLDEGELRKAFISHALGQANIEICKIVKDRQTPVGSTGTAIALDGRRLWGAHVGDCRVLIVDEELSLKRLTREHRARGNKLERSLGASYNVACDTFECELPECWAVIMCCDGVWEHVTDAEMVEIVENHSQKDVAGRMVSTAFDHGSDDDLTVVYVESAAMKALKRKRSVQRDVKAVRDGARERVSLEKIVEYFIEERDVKSVREFFDIYLEVIDGIGKGKATLVNSALDLVQRRDSTEYGPLLTTLWDMDQLPERRLADLVDHFYEQAFLGDMACRAYEQYHKANPGDHRSCGYFGLCLLKRGERTTAERQLQRAFDGSDESLQSVLLELLGDPKLGEPGRELQLRMSVYGKRPGIAQDLIEQLQAAQGRNDKSRAADLEELLRQVDETYPFGSADKAKAKSAILELSEQRESARLGAKVKQLQVDLDCANGEANRLHKRIATLEKSLESERSEKQAFKMEFDQAQQQCEELERDLLRLHKRSDSLAKENTRLKKEIEDCRLKPQDRARDHRKDDHRRDASEDDKEGIFARVADNIRLSWKVVKIVAVIWLVISIANSFGGCLGITN